MSWSWLRKLNERAKEIEATKEAEEAEEKELRDRFAVEVMGETPEEEKLKAFFSPARKIAMKLAIRSNLMVVEPCRKKKEEYQAERAKETKEAMKLAMDIVK